MNEIYLPSDIEMRMRATGCGILRFTENSGIKYRNTWLVKSSGTFLYHPPILIFNVDIVYHVTEEEA